MKPISIEEVEEAKSKTFPGFVIEAFNNMIVKNWNGCYAEVNQDDVIQEILRLSTHTITREVVFDNGWLDIESVYRKEGWKVEYDRPAYCESYQAHFIFSKNA